MKTYIFHVSLPGTGRVWRKIEMRADQTLEKLHFAIQGAFRWDTDHLYAFFMSGKAWDSRTEYTLPEGYDPWGNPVEDDEDDEIPILTPEQREANLRQLFGQDTDMTLEQMEASMAGFWEEYLAEEVESGPRNVQTTRLQGLGLRLNQTFMYLFDYGDEHRFKVRVHAIDENADPTAEYPRIVESVGPAPPQYHWWGE